MWEWDLELVEEMFTDGDAECIKAMEPPSGDVPDERIWRLSHDGQFTVRSAYRLSLEGVDLDENLPSDGRWSKVWKLVVPPKMKHLVWRFLRGIIPTREALNRRGVEMTLACGCCDNEEESLEHLFFQCPVAARCWEVAGMGSEVRAAMTAGDEAADWLTRLISDPDSSRVQDVVALVWSLWHERNDRVWNQQSKCEELIVRLGKEHVQEWWALKQGAGNARAQPPTVNQERSRNRWSRPDLGAIKINIDAALFFDAGRYGVGLVARDAQGSLIGYRQQLFPGTPPANEAEANGLIEAIRWAEVMGWTRVVYETDCQFFCCCWNYVVWFNNYTD
ncbi:Putative ribonuclease H protein At1g65750 [Linum perenne]